MRERKNKDLDHVKCIKSDDYKVLVKDNDIRERWRAYFVSGIYLLLYDKSSKSEESIGTNEDMNGYGAR